MATLDLQHLDKVYEKASGLAVEDFNMHIEDGEFIVLVGPSGCGKSTTLRMIAGLETISRGNLLIDGEDVTSKAAKDRDIAMVFQNYALYAHMTIYQNMAFSLTLRKEKPTVIHEKVMAAAKILGLVEQLNKKPKALSGGQRQRVALGRSIVRDPKVFLFDEPLSNLDAKLRSSMRREIKLLHQRLKSTMIYVTHDQIEALTLADRIVVMSMGHVQQIGTPLEIYNDPNNIFVASFIGNPPMNFIKGTVKSGNFVSGKIVLPLDEENKARLKNYEGKDVTIGVRPEHIKLGNTLKFNIGLSEHLGQATLIHGVLNDEKDCIFKLAGWQRYGEGDIIKIDFDMKRICFFDSATEQRIK